jgi:hypothetical protein
MEMEQAGIQYMAVYSMMKISIENIQVLVCYQWQIMAEIQIQVNF